MNHAFAGTGDERPLLRRLYDGRGEIVSVRRQIQCRILFTAAVVYAGLDAIVVTEGVVIDGWLELGVWWIGCAAVYAAGAQFIRDLQRHIVADQHKMGELRHCLGENSESNAGRPWEAEFVRHSWLNREDASYWDEMILIGAIAAFSAYLPLLIAP